MADYTQQISSTTTLMIRDTGSWVEFWVKTGSTTWNNSQQWSFRANGSDSSVRTYRMVAGGGWQMFGAVLVEYNQDVRFTIYNSGLGFPTYDFWQAIGRGSVPQAPNITETYAISGTQIRVKFSAGHDGGSPILGYEIGYSSNPNSPEGTIPSGGNSDLGPFVYGQRVYFWARARNAVGWSSWGNRTEATTWRPPDIPPSAVFSDVDQKSVVVDFVDPYDGGTPLTERQIGYGFDPLDDLGATTVLPAVAGPNLVTGLLPGKTYYFWTRNRNVLDWSAWSKPVGVTLIAGARVYIVVPPAIGGQWKRAVPWVKHNGVWKVARPWVRVSDVWKETSV